MYKDFRENPLPWCQKLRVRLGELLIFMWFTLHIIHGYKKPRCANSVTQILKSNHFHSPQRPLEGTDTPVNVSLLPTLAGHDNTIVYHFIFQFSTSQGIH